MDHAGDAEALGGVAEAGEGFRAGRERLCARPTAPAKRTSKRLGGGAAVRVKRSRRTP